MSTFDMIRDRYISIVFGADEKALADLEIADHFAEANRRDSDERRRGEGSPHDRPGVAGGRRPAEGAIVVGVPDDISMQVLTENECLALLSSQEVGRIAFAFEDRIEIFPINYGLEGAVIVFRTSPGTKLEAVPKTAVAFEADSWDSETGIGWSVVARGPAEEVTTNVGRVAEHLRWVPVHPVAPGERWHWLAVKPTEITGRRFRVPATKPERT